jgi:hypothetical protein
LNDDNAPESIPIIELIDEVIDKILLNKIDEKIL